MTRSSSFECGRSDGRNEGREYVSLTCASHNWRFLSSVSGFLGVSCGMGGEG